MNVLGTWHFLISRPVFKLVFMSGNAIQWGWIIIACQKDISTGRLEGLLGLFGNVAILSDILYNARFRINYFEVNSLNWKKKSRLFFNFVRPPSFTTRNLHLKDKIKIRFLFWERIHLWSDLIQYFYGSWNSLWSISNDGAWCVFKC